VDGTAGLEGAIDALGDRDPAVRNAAATAIAARLPAGEWTLSLLLRNEEETAAQGVASYPTTVTTTAVAAE
jgi:hypothetical protein